MLIAGSRDAVLRQAHRRSRLAVRLCRQPVFIKAQPCVLNMSIRNYAQTHDPTANLQPDHVDDAFQKVLSLCRRRGFIFRTGSQFTSPRGVYDYGPLGVELKQNIAEEWWKHVVHCNPEVFGMKTCQLMPASVWKASGHLEGFTDSIVDCKLSGVQFRIDKAGPITVHHNDKDGNSTLIITAPDKKTAKVWAQQIQREYAVGAKLAVKDKMIHMQVDKVRHPDADNNGSYQSGWIDFIGNDKNCDTNDLDVNTKPHTIRVAYNGYVTRGCNSPFLGKPRDINLMYQIIAGYADGQVSNSLHKETSVNDEFYNMIDTVNAISNTAVDQTTAASTIQTIRNHLKQSVLPRSMYLRPETAQGTYVQARNAVQALMNTGSKLLSFGLAQIGRSYRNEISVEHFSFRSSEFDQMELQYFCPPEHEKRCFEYWVEDRISWWQRYARVPSNFVTVNIEKSELAHYASACVDIEYKYPWGYDEIEGIASRTNFDMSLHSQIHDPNSNSSTECNLDDLFVIEPAAGLSRAVLAFLCDAYTEETKVDAKGKSTTRTVLQLHPMLSPFKVAILPLVKSKCEFVQKALAIQLQFQTIQLRSSYDDNGAIGKRYAKHDEIGTPLCITIDQMTLEDDSVTLRDRRDGTQWRVSSAHVTDAVQKYIDEYNYVNTQ
eukprot:CFRG1286T1